MFWLIFCLISALKLIFVPAYRSTDFEVHRNWLAITHSLPLKEWYYEKTSEWTLDYPPFFAYFEYILSQFAKYFDSEMLKVENLSYASEKTILFQRLSVIVCDLVFGIGVKRCLDVVAKNTKVHNYVATLLLGNIGLLMVDHIHFQYNGFLFGILLLSVADIFNRNYIRSAILFASLLHFKHIFMYIAPVFTVFLFKFYCVGEKRIVRNTVLLGATVGVVSICSLGPFYDQLPQLVERLFPFKRGLSHAYWAPNFWALYNFIDKLLTILFKIKIDRSASNTSGLVQTFEHQVLPPISPLITFVLTFIFILPCIVKIITGNYRLNEQPKIFIQSIVLCGCSSFLFGWHVHEKAILMVTIPLTLLTYLNDYNGKQALFLTLVGNYSLFPLLFPRELTLVKFFLYTSSLCFSLYGYKIVFSERLSLIFNIYEKLFLFGLILIYFYENIIHSLLGLDEKLPFLPLLLTSVYCSIGIISFWLKYYYKFLFDNENEIVKKKIKTK